jgi:hypothetical protein
MNSKAFDAAYTKTTLLDQPDRLKLELPRKLLSLHDAPPCSEKSVLPEAGAAQAGILARGGQEEPKLMPVDAKEAEYGLRLKRS